MLSEEMKPIFENELKEVSLILSHNRQKGIRKYALFLDFDGVIHVFYVEGTKKYREALKRLKRNFDFVDPESLANLDQLVEMYDMDVIISSSWRYNGLDYCQKYLAKSGMKNSDHVIATTQKEDYLDRRLEIVQYLKEHPVYSGFLVLDDMAMPEFRRSDIHTDPTVGFDEKKLDQAEKVLKRYDSLKGAKDNGCL